MKKALVALVAVVGSAAMAYAADLPMKAAPYVPPTPLTDWSGFYVGVHGGYGWNSRNDWDLVAADEGDIGPIGTGHGPKGGLAGGQIGYNKQINQWVFGIQADGSWANIKGTAGNPLNLEDGRCGFSGFPDQSADCRATIKAMGNLTARAGYLVTPATLLYVKGGVNISSIDLQVLNDIAINSEGDCAEPGVGTRYPGYNAVNHTRAAGTAGAGIEQRIYPNVTIFGEYDYIGNGGTSTNLNTGGTGSGGCTANFISRTRVGNTQVVKFGLNYMFNSPVVAKY